MTDAHEPDMARPVVRVEGLAHRYRREVALDGVDVKIAPGRSVGLIGPDGVGKSTLMGLIAGARRMQTGLIEVLGHDMSDAAARRRAGPRIAYMPQGLGRNLYAELSIAENLTFFARLYGLSRQERHARIEQLTTATGLRPFLERPAGKLSGGMKQKLGLCCALIHDPDLLILDEPTTGIDPLSRQQFWQLMADIRLNRPRMTLLVSTAYMDEATRFDDLIAMNEGRIIGSGTPAEIMARTGTDDLERAYVALLPARDRDRTAAGEFAVAPRQRTDGASPAIMARGLTRKFGDFTAVDHVDIEIEKGEIFGFLGSNGCGKTTTMKMLTGLLPPTSGEAFLFGNAVDAGSNAMRRRVGYMSQSFSLYGELTVAQNLYLHARLFHLGADRGRRRIEDLTERFGLEPYLDERAGGLPLGVRQRLSLAVAILHEPEMLILDEPTSGVDPIARDAFWRILVELSRNEGVTIFVSTHFMNEAMRCDRISLMHAGKVLAVGAPEDLVAEKGAATLEDAFVDYMRAALDGDAAADEFLTNGDGRAEARPAAELGAAVASPAVKPAPDREPGLSATRTFAYALRETKEILRDPVRLAFAFIGTTILLFIFSYGITTDVEKVTFAVLDQDRTPQSREYVARFEGSRYFERVGEIASRDDLERRLVANDITVALEIPPNFGRDLKRRAHPEVSAWIDGSNTMRASTIEGYVAGVHATALRDWGAMSPAPKMERAGGSASTLVTRYLYNPSFESIYAIGPSVPAMLLILFPAILMAVSVVREKEIGTITNFYVTPSYRLEFIVGKQLPYIAITVANFLLMTLIVIYLFGVPLKGSFAALFLGAVIYAVATTGYGLLIATVTKSQVAAVFATAILSMMPTFLFSGFLQPVSSLEGGARVLGTLWPTTYYLHASVGAFTKGLGIAELTPDLLALAVFGPVFVAIAAFFLKKQEK